MRRVNEAIRAVVGDALKELKDARIGFVTITGVDTSADLASARVFVSVLGSEKRRARTLDGLEAAHGYLQARVGRELRLQAHSTPDLRVRSDGRARGPHVSTYR